jgi:hypothetical protein
VENAGVPPGIPRIYEFSQNLQIVHAYYLADDEEVKARLAGLKI